ncbi:MAG: Bifunctional protein: zinc-containing alcohol dehydrogenase; quinone oxidoreductase (NADPH:quinone reductase); Similar to arginate lyase, partial [uncultured Sphingomonadaceae bacterium]
ASCRFSGKGRHRSRRYPGRYRSSRSRPRRPRPAGRGQGRVGQSDRREGATEQPARRRKLEGARLGRGGRRQRGRTRRHAVPRRRSGLLRRCDRTLGDERAVPSGRRAHRRREAQIAGLGGSGRAAADGDHRVGGAVRPARCRQARPRGRARVADHRRRGGRKLDRDPACARADRPDGDRDGVAAGNGRLGAGDGRASGRRSRPTARRTGRGARAGKPRLRLLDDAHRPASRRNRRADRAAGPPRRDRRPPDAGRRPVGGQVGVDPLGDGFHPHVLLHRRHGGAGQAARPCVAADRRGPAPHHGDRAPRADRRGQPDARARHDGEGREARQDRAGGVRGGL